MTKPDLNIIQFEQYQGRALAVLAKMKIDLDEYRKKPNANAGYIERNENILKMLLEYTTEIVPEFINYLQDENAQRYDHGYNTGYAAAESKYVWKPNRLDKENFRTFEILRLKQEMPELF